jgi:hypothetical protein
VAFLDSVPSVSPWSFRHVGCAGLCLIFHQLALALAHFLHCNKQLLQEPFPMSQESARLAVAAHLHVLMRRKLGRVTDTEWMASNLEYATEVIRVCRKEDDLDLQIWADKLDAVMASLRPRRPKEVPAANEVPSTWPDSVLRGAAPEPVKARQIEQRYVGRLR